MNHSISVTMQTLSLETPTTEIVLSNTQGFCCNPYCHKGTADRFQPPGEREKASNDYYIWDILLRPRSDPRLLQGCWMLMTGSNCGIAPKIPHQWSYSRYQWHADNVETP